METMNDFCVLGRLDDKPSKVFNFSSKDFDGTPVNKSGCEVFINVMMPGGNEGKILLTAYKKEILESYFGKYVIIKGSFKAQTFQGAEDKVNYKTVLVVKESGGVIPLNFYQNKFQKKDNTSNYNNSNPKRDFKANANKPSNIENNDDIWS